MDLKDMLAEQRAAFDQLWAAIRVKLRPIVAWLARRLPGR